MPGSTDWLVSKPRQRGEAWVRREGDGTAVFMPETQTLHLLNPSALAIWELCDGDTTAEEMAEAVDEIAGIGLDRSRSDVASALEALAEAGLIET